MKKLLIAGLLLLGISATAFAQKGDFNIYPRVGAGIHNSVSMDGTTIESDSASWEVSIEGTRELTDNFEVGLGIGFQQLADVKNKIDGYTLLTGEDYESYPLYVLAKYNFPVVGDSVRPYAVAHLGYAFNGDVKVKVEDTSWKEGVDNGLYAGIGAGFEQNNINVDAMFKTTQAEADGDDFDQYRFVLSVGYRFNIPDFTK